MDSAQRVRPADLPKDTLDELNRSAKTAGRLYPLTSQIQVRGGDDYIRYMRGMLDPESHAARTPDRFIDYGLRFYDDFGEMQDAIEEADRRVGLARLVAGYSWDGVSRGDSGLGLRRRAEP